MGGGFGPPPPPPSVSSPKKGPSWIGLNWPRFNQSSQSNQLFLDCLVKVLNLYVDCAGLLIYLVLFNYKFSFVYVVYILLQLPVTHSYVISIFSFLSFIFFMNLTPYIYVINVLETSKQDKSCQKIQNPREIPLAGIKSKENEQKVFWGRNCWCTIWR